MGITKSRTGQMIMRKRGEETNGGAGGGGDPSEEFFASLPQDEFSKEEEALRDALLAFLRKWPQSKPPTVLQVKRDPMVAKSIRPLLPPGCPVPLQDWVDKRIGGEVQVGGGPAEATS